MPRQKAVSANFSKMTFLANITNSVIIRLVYDYLSLFFRYWWKKHFIHFDIFKITLLNRAKKAVCYLLPFGSVKAPLPLQILPFASVMMRLYQTEASRYCFRRPAQHIFIKVI